MVYFVIIRGPLGVGKTTISDMLALVLSSEKVKSKCFHVDEILAKNKLDKVKPGLSCISLQNFIKVNNLIIPKAKKLLEKDTVVIIEGNFYYERQIKDLISKINFPNYVFTLKAPESVCIQRDAERNKSLGHEAVKAVYALVSRFDYGITVDASRSGKQYIGFPLRSIMLSLPKLESEIKPNEKELKRWANNTYKIFPKKDKYILFEYLLQIRSLIDRSTYSLCPMPMNSALINLFECYKSAYFLTVHGFYESSLSQLRIGLDYVLINAYYNLKDKEAKTKAEHDAISIEYQNWKSGIGRYPPRKDILNKVFEGDDASKSEAIYLLNELDKYVHKNPGNSGFSRPNWTLEFKQSKMNEYKIKEWYSRVYTLCRKIIIKEMPLRSTV